MEFPVRTPSCLCGADNVVWSLHSAVPQQCFSLFSKPSAPEHPVSSTEPVGTSVTGHNRQINSQRRRPGCLNFYHRRLLNCPEMVRSGMYLSSQQQQEGNPATSDAQVDSQIRYAPYAISSHHRRRGSFRKQYQTRGKMEKEQNLPERRMEGTQGGISSNWFKITIPFGIKYNEQWLLDLIQSQCSIPFRPVEFHYDKMQAHFFVENSCIASALKDISGKIWDENHEGISIFVTPSEVPCSVQEELKLEKVEQIKLSTNIQGDASQQPADIKSLSSDPDSMAHNIEMASNPRMCEASSLQIHEENMPKVKSLGKTDKEKGLDPEEMCMDRNPQGATCPDKSSNINSILELFPKLLSLDGPKSPGTLCGTEANKMLPTSKGSFFGSEILKNVILQFLQQYYLFYDYGDRCSLLDAYHDEACFSLTMPFNSMDLIPSGLCEYLKNSRNIKNVTDRHLRRQLLQHTNHAIVDVLRVLPRTQHDFSSFLVDMWFETETMLCFSVNGVFKEVEGDSQGCVWAFTRTFITIPTSNSSLCIMNDKLFMQNTRTQEPQSAFSISVPTPCSSSMPTLSQAQQEMVQALSIQYGVNLEWSQKCLHDNNWDYARAAQFLTLPKRMQDSPFGYQAETSSLQLTAN
ncbi:nuclear RNA export factor 3 [Lepus europaeus]|uniref:nuclear RNA export factor 3 n=1 Tax=Lepus europaeus TaxID=9983 RepID=UPI002B461956|nr:nuclear RNA export factor 3 [Lepus europaeus]